jgi:hypothetical protein
VWSAPGPDLPVLAPEDDLPACLGTVRAGETIFDTGILAS